MINNQLSMAKQRGGKRPGAGRPPGARNKRTLAQAKEARTLTELAREATVEAISTLRRIAGDAQAPASAQVAAATALLDRAWGRPPQRIELDEPSLAAADNTLRLIQPGDEDYESLPS